MAPLPPPLLHPPMSSVIICQSLRDASRRTVFQMILANFLYVFCVSHRRPVSHAAQGPTVVFDATGRIATESIRCGLLLPLQRGLCICLSVYLCVSVGHEREPAKSLNRLMRRLDCRLVGP